MRLGQNHKALGIVFLAMLVLGVYLTYGIFTKKWTDYAELTLRTSKIGLQLPTRADVKTRGVIVGEVLDFDADADGAVLTLGIYPDKLDTIPANVTGSIVPKTLFGEKYVSLEVPETGPAGTMKAGAVIDRTEVSIEVEKVLSDLYPLLRAVSPADINYTLNALATALEGRGESVGENLETLDAYLKRVNPQIPDIVEDLRLTARVSDLYVDVLPDVAQILRDTIRTTGTLEGREAKLRALFRDVASFSDTARTFLDDNEDNLIRLGDLSAAQLRRVRQVRAGVPLPARRHRRRRQGPGRGVPRLHPAHRARAAAQPAARLHGRPTPRASARTAARTALNLPEPAVDAGQPGAPRSPTSTTASTSRPARARRGSLPASAPTEARATPAAPGRGRHAAHPARPRPSASRPSRSTTSACCSSRRWPGERR